MREVIENLGLGAGLGRINQVNVELGMTTDRCSECGRFVGVDDVIVKGTAIVRLITPSSYFTKEEYETLCPIHYAKEKQRSTRESEK